MKKMPVIFKPKGYVTDRKDSKLISEKPKRYIPICWDLWEVDELRVVYSKKYEKDISKAGPVIKKKIKSLINDIRKGYVYTDGPLNKDSDTHVLPDFSKLDYLVWTKSYTTSDRITYFVHEPRVIEKDDTKLSIMTIVITSCFGHNLCNEKSYSKVWRIKRKTVSLRDIRENRKRA